MLHYIVTVLLRYYFSNTKLLYTIRQEHDQSIFHFLPMCTDVALTSPAERRSPKGLWQTLEEKHTNADLSSQKNKKMAAMWPARMWKSSAVLTRSSVALTFTRSNSKGEQQDKGWFRSLFVHKVDQRKDAHSNLLSKKETSSLYKMQFHNVKPECLDAYNSLSEQILQKLHNDPEYPCEIVGSWNTWYGEQDQAVHLWRFSGGYPALTDAMEKLKQNKEYLEFRKERSKMLLARKNQLLLEFSFWNEPLPRPGPNIYELRTYYLKPGTMIEWGNNWARAIRFRQENDEAVGGFFSLVGDLYVVHHIWAYKDLESRQETRNAAWQKPGWDDCVYYTVPLIRYMESRIMIPLKISTLQ